MRQDHAVVAVQVIKLLQDLVTHMYMNVYGMERKHGNLSTPLFT